MWSIPKLPITVLAAAIVIARDDLGYLWHMFFLKTWTGRKYQNFREMRSKDKINTLIRFAVNKDIDHSMKR